VVGFVSQLPGRFKDALGDLLSLLVEKGNDLLQGLWNGIKAIASQVETWFGDLPGHIKEWLGALIDTLKQHGVDLLEGLLNGVKDKAAEVATWFGDLPEKVIGWIGDVASKLFSKGVALIQGMIDGVQAKAPALADAVARAAANAATFGVFGQGGGGKLPETPHSAAGRFVTSPMLSVIGEAGAEAVINRDQALRLVWNLANASSGQAGGSAGTGGASYQYGPNYITNTVDESDVVSAFRRMELLAG
jgi:hypothetical protein